MNSHNKNQNSAIGNTVNIYPNPDQGKQVVGSHNSAGNDQFIISVNKIEGDNNNLIINYNPAEVALLKEQIRLLKKIIKSQEQTIRNQNRLIKNLKKNQ